eukprot:405741-Pelagomonas_calceolata.AAC.3
MFLRASPSFSPSHSMNTVAFSKPWPTAKFSKACMLRVHNNGTYSPRQGVGRGAAVSKNLFIPFLASFHILTYPELNAS